MRPLTQLICANLSSNDGPLGEISDHLAQTLNRVLDKSVELRKDGGPVDLAMFAPLLCRSTLELAATAMVARFDPLRVLAIRKSQQLTSYDPNSPNPIRFDWAQDVIGDKGKSWSEKFSIKDLQRSFLSNHVHELLWQDAFERTLDSVDVSRGSNWFSSLRTVQPEHFTAFMRTEASKLYSELSKGIHSEFVIPVQYQFDRPTVLDLLDRVWMWTANLAITAAHSKSILAPTTLALNLYEKAQTELYS